MSLNALILNKIPSEWETILKRHKVFGIFTRMVYDHSIHKSRRTTNWCKENCIVLRRTLNGNFLNSFNLERAVKEHPKYSKEFWINIDLEINQLKTNLK